MKTQRNILVAFILNLSFSIFEFFGGLFTGSVAILSDALHDLGDAISIGVAFFLERKSTARPDETHTYGYGRYSVLGGLITTVILLTGSVLVIYQGINRLLHPTPIHYNGMILFAVVGAVVNLIAAFVTREGDSINQRAVNLHMLEDVLGWLVVLVGAVVIRLTDLVIIDPLLSIGVAVFILINALRTMKEVLDLFLEKTPKGICLHHIKERLLQIDGIVDVHHIHIWSIDGVQHSATMHIRTDADGHNIKEAVRKALLEDNIVHATIELERSNETCHDQLCHPVKPEAIGHHHHHHHHGHHHH